MPKEHATAEKLKSNQIQILNVMPIIHDEDERGSIFEIV
jgi:hypothetical protein